MRRANPKKKTAKQRAEKLTKDEANKINAGSRIIISEAIFYLFTEYGWRKKRCDRLLDTYSRKMEEYAVEFRKKYNVGGIVAQRAGYDVIPEVKEYYDLRLNTPDALTLAIDTFCIAIMCRALKELKFGKKMIARYIESIEAILNEIGNPRLRFTPNDMYEWCAAVTGVDVRRVA